MLTRVARAALAAALFSAPAAAQKVAVTEAEAHVISAFVSGADPGVIASDVSLGPVLRQELGGETDSRRIYNALFDRAAGKGPRVSLLTPAEAVAHAALPGVKAGEPLLRLEADGVTLLLQYAAARKSVTFVETLGAPVARSEAPKPVVETPPTAPQPPAPLTTIPLPTEPPPVPRVVAPAAAAVPAARMIEKPQPPKPPAVAAQKVAPPAPPRVEPRGECVVKPVMSDEDLRNCAAVSGSRSTAAPAAVVVEPAAAGTAAIVAPAPKPRPDCVIKPVMTDEELRTCAAVSTPRARPAETVAPAVAVQTSAPPAAAPKPKPECVIKPVMTDEEMRICAAVQTPRAPAPEATVAQKPAAPAPAEAPKPRPQCVIKPVMSDEELRACR